jgi:putative transcriptional regulator
MSDDEVEAAARSDPDGAPPTVQELQEFRRIIDPKSIRERTGLTQEEFARVFGLPLGTVRDWEQRRTRPDAAAENYLRVIEHEPEAAKRAIGSR